jgi:hypothetical protein
MTSHSSFKRVVRARMEKTGESYTAARASLLNGSEPEQGTAAGFATSDEEILRRTGRGWEEWFDLLDEWGAPERTHREAARWLAEQQDADPLAWNVQAVVKSYERVRGGKAVGEKEDGFTVTASKTVAVPVERLYDALLEMAEDMMSERSATRPKAAHFDWDDDGSRVHVTFEGRGPGKSRLALSHERLADADEAERMKAFWRERVSGLKEEMER